MLVSFNILIILLIGVIGYWWANQGLFSALLHLVCVITAGALALGLWEPIVVGFLLKGGGFDGFAWGMTLVGVFAFCLITLRVATDKIVPANVDLPRWANFGFGFPVGVAAGVLTVGMVIIGMGFTQSSVEIIGYRGYGRDLNTGKVVKFREGLWAPVHFWTAEFYSWMSATSMWTPDAMHHRYPKLHWQASLMRDSYNNGKGAIAIPPDGVSVDVLLWNAGGTEAAITLTLKASGMDFGEQLTLSSSQVRLIDDARGTQKARAVHPSRWVQDQQIYEFDNVSHYVTSTPARESTSATLVFPLPANFIPKYVQIKGLRLRLPAPQPLPMDLASIAGGGDTFEVPDVADLGGASQIAPGDLEISNDIRPLRVGVNGVPGTMKVQDRYLVEGEATFTGPPSQVSRKMMIQGIMEPKGTRIIKLDVSRGRAADLFRKSLRETVSENATIKLVDTEGNSYSPLGYIQNKQRGAVSIKLAPGKYLRRLSDLPYLPTSGAEKLRLYFRVTENAELVALMVDKEVVAMMSVQVPPR